MAYHLLYFLEKAKFINKMYLLFTKEILVRLILEKLKGETVPILSTGTSDMLVTASFFRMSNLIARTTVLD